MSATTSPFADFGNFLSNTKENVVRWASATQMAQDLQQSMDVLHAMIFKAEDNGDETQPGVAFKHVKFVRNHNSGGGFVLQGADGTELARREPAPTTKNKVVASVTAGSLYRLDNLLATPSEREWPQVAFEMNQSIAESPASERENETDVLAQNDLPMIDDGPLEVQERIVTAQNALPFIDSELRPSQDDNPQAIIISSYATAYAPATGNTNKAPFDALLGKSKSAAASPVGKPKLSDAELQKLSAGNPHWWYDRQLPASSSSAKEQRCLAEAVYFESRGEPYDGQVAVAQVVLNRVKNPAYPNTICGVVYQNQRMRNACQFSFACDGIPERVIPGRYWTQAKEIARKTVEGSLSIPEVGASTHYHAQYVRPNWAPTMKRLKKIGLHIFYKTYNGGWS